ncbi:MAG: hypothetical protein IH845_05805 [Nanoarchaeota archaeon]|nr:hypothetical protein [Nanoarchaeota archaeon]
METSIQVSKNLLGRLKEFKLYSKESYEEVIWDLIEDRMELSEETKKNIAEAEEQYKKGEYETWDKVKKDLGINV